MNASVGTNRRQQLIASLLAKAGVKAAPDRIARRPHGTNVASLSSGQRSMWLLNRIAPDDPVYNVPTCFRIRGPLDIAAFEGALNEIVRRHEILRTTFRTRGDEPVQWIHPELPIFVERVAAGSTDLAAIRNLAVKDARRPFCLESGPLIRATMFSLSDRDHVVLIAMHHIVCDAWSMVLLFRELSVMYAARVAGSAARLPDLPIQYADYADWQQERLASGKLQSQIDHWQQHLRGAQTEIELPTDRPRPPESEFRGAVLPLVPDQDVSNALLAMAQDGSVTPFVLFLAAYAVLLHRYSSQSDLIIGCPVSNRTRKELEGLIGFFPNTLPLRIKVLADESFLQLLRRVRDVSTQAFANAEAPLESIATAFGGARSGQNLLFQVAYTMQENTSSNTRVGDLEISPIDLDLGTAKCDLTFVGTYDSTGVSFAFEYNTDLFDKATVRRMALHFETLLAAIASDPDTTVSNLPLMAPDENRRVTKDWSTGRICPRDGRTFPELFETNVQRQPSAPALLYASEITTYAELDAKANRIAQALRQRGVGSGALVAIAHKRSPELVAAILGVMKSGAAYLPIALDHPAERIRFQIEDAHPVILITSGPALSKLPKEAHELDRLDLQHQTDQSAVVCRAHLSDLAYVIYTSGSTGRPKGTMLEHGGLANLALAQQELFQLGPGERVLQFAPSTFDASVWEIAMSLGSGACLCLGSGAPFVPEELTRTLREQHVTVVTLPPSLLRALRPADFPELRTVISAGEDCSAALAQQWSGGNRRFFNAYGPTEATVCATVAESTGSYPQMTIGRPLPNTRIYVLDPLMNPVPMGVTGEIYIGGAGVARGYLNRPELTFENFAANPFENGERVYRTGDLARWLSNGEIEFRGRIDGQVKIRGHRIEIGEIETQLAQHPAVCDCAVVVRKEAGRDDRLVAYYVPRGEPGDLRHFLSQTIPEYMVPAAFVPLEQLPLNGSGKVDRRALAKLDPLSSREKTSPRDQLESRVARIWSEVLGIPIVDVSENFFESGGSSLTAVQLVTRLAAETGCEVPVTALFQAGTVEQVAQLIRERQGKGTTQSGRLLKLQPGGTKRPLIMIPPAGGSLICYSELARSMAPDQPIWGIEPARRSEHAASVEALATEHIHELRARGATGPWRLAGWSLGGNIAYEMARQFTANGEAVEVVALIDCHAAHKGREPREGEILLEIAQVQASARGAALRIDRTALRRANGGDAAMFIASELERDTGVAPEAMARELRTIVQRFRSDIRAGRRYEAGPYSGRVVLLRTPGPVWSRGNGWARWCPTLEIHSISGAHRTVLNTPHVQELANRLRQILGT